VALPVTFEALLNIIQKENGQKLRKLAFSFFGVVVAVQWSKLLAKNTFSASDISIAGAYRGLMESK
jgi:hypothetical protein